MPIWKRNLYVVCVAEILTLIGFSSYTTFIPYYVQTFSDMSDAAAVSWAAGIQTVGMLAMMIAAPFWGVLADRYGRKIMMVRATGAAAVVVFLMGVAREPSQLMALRVMQGVFCGTVAAANTLVASITPENALGRSLGLLQTAIFAANAIGPLFGGLAADAFGYRAVFPIASGLMVIALIGVIFLVQEKRDPLVRTSQGAAGFRIRLDPKVVTRTLHSETLYLLIAISGASFAGSVLAPVLPMYVKALAPDSPNLATLAGTINSIMAITSAVAAVGIGAIGDRFGQRKTLLMSALGVSLAAIPQAFVSTTGQLMALRALHGIFVGGIMPTANALLARATPPERRGSVLGLASSANSGGAALGPVVGAAVANAWGFSSTFLVTAGVFAVLSALVGLRVKDAPAIQAAEGVPLRGQREAQRNAGHS